MGIDLESNSLVYSSYLSYAKSISSEDILEMRIENFHIMRSLTGFTDGYEHHPKGGFWQGREIDLLYLQYALCYEWEIVRGFDDEGILRKTSDMFWDCLRIDFERVPEPFSRGKMSL